MAQSIETPILALFRQWYEFRLLVNNVWGSEEAREAGCDRLQELENQNAVEPTTCLEDFAAKILAETGNGDFDLWRISDNRPGAMREAQQLVSGGMI